MRYILLITTFFLFSKAIAQPILTAANTNPVPGDTYTLTVCDTTGLAAAATGPGGGKTWDYSHVNPLFDGFDSLYLVQFANCSTTPYCDSFPGSNIADVEYTYFFGGESDTFYEYFFTDASQYSDLGNTDGFTFSHSNPPEKILRYPFTYLSELVDTNAYFDVTDSTYSFITDTFVADGYGTLKLPSGTYSNVLRVHVFDFESDTVYFSGDTTISTYSSDIYLWFVPGFHYPVLEVDNDTLFGQPVSAEYFSGALDPDGVHNVASALQDVTVFPNPASDQVHIAYTSLTGQPATLRLTDVIGKCISTETIDNPLTGINETAISVATLPPGIYFLQVQSRDNVVSKKINVVR